MIEYTLDTVHPLSFLSERRYPSLGDIANRWATRTKLVRKVPSRDGAIPAAAHASPASVGSAQCIGITYR